MTSSQGRRSRPRRRSTAAVGLGGAALVSPFGLAVADPRPSLIYTVAGRRSVYVAWRRRLPSVGAGLIAALATTSSSHVPRQLLRVWAVATLYVPAVACGSPPSDPLRLPGPRRLDRVPRRRHAGLRGRQRPGTAAGFWRRSANCCRPAPRSPRCTISSTSMATVGQHAARAGQLRHPRCDRGDRCVQVPRRSTRSRP